MNFHDAPDLLLISKIKGENCSDSVVELRHRHEGIIQQMAKRYSSSAQCSGVAVADLTEDADYLVYKAATDFDPDKGVKFVTWLGTVAKFHCLNTIGKQSKYFSSQTEGITEAIADKMLNEEEYEKKAISENLEYIQELLHQVKDERVKHLINKKYFGPEKRRVTFTEIAKDLDMSVQGTINLHNHFIEFVKAKLRGTEFSDQI